MPEPESADPFAYRRPALRTVRRWVELIAQGDLRGAFALLDPKSYDASDAGFVEIEEWFTEYLALHDDDPRKQLRFGREAKRKIASGNVPRVCRPSDAGLDDEHATWFAEPEIPVTEDHLEYRLPVNGRWSAIVAKFWVYPEGGGVRVAWDGLKLAYY